MSSVDLLAKFTITAKVNTLTAYVQETAKQIAWKSFLNMVSFCEHHALAQQDPSDSIQLDGRRHSRLSADSHAARGVSRSADRFSREEGVRRAAPVQSSSLLDP